MSNAVLAITYAPVPGFPSGTVVGGVVATITGTAAGNTTPQTQTVAAATPVVTFSNLVADSYTFSVQAQDGATPPNLLGTAVTGTFTITATSTVTLQLPSAVAVSQA